LNYFSRLAGLKEANRAGAGEALWFSVHNFLQCGSITNVFIVKDGVLTTPPTNEELRDPSVREATPYPRSNVLPGVTRGTIIELAQAQDLPVRIAPVDVHQLLDADEVLLTNSVMQVMPVCRIEKRPIGNDRPGEMTLRLTELYRDAVDAETSV